MLIAPYQRVANIKQDVDIRKYNKIQADNKIRKYLASLPAAPILRKRLQ